MRKLGAKSVIALVVPDREVAFKILALNTEKAHSLKEKSLEQSDAPSACGRASREHRARACFRVRPATVSTLGAAYEQSAEPERRRRNSVLRRIDDFLDERLPRALKEPTRRAGLVLAIDDHVTAIVGI